MNSRPSPGKLGNGRGALERWPRKQALTIGRGAGTEQRGEVGLSHSVERIANRNVSKRHPPRHQEVTTLQPLLEELCPHRERVTSISQHGIDAGLHLRRLVADTSDA